LTQNQEIKGSEPLEKKAKSSQSSTLYAKLLAFAKAYCNCGNYPLEGFEVDIHEMLQSEITEDVQQFLREVLPFLIADKWLPETATPEDVWVLFRKHDSWHDLDLLDDFLEKTIASLQKVNTTSDIGTGAKLQLAKLLIQTSTELALELDFIGPFPVTSPSDHGNVPFRRLITDLYRAVYNKSTLIREFVRR